jgi:hypothetical protein
MIKLLIFGHRRPGISRAEGCRHLARVHGPMVYDPPVDAGAMPARYAQNHACDGLPARPGDRWLSDRDFVTEVWFEDFPSLIASTSTPYYRQHLQPDEENFVDQATVLKAVVREGEIRGVVPATAWRLFLFLSAAEGQDADTFARDAAQVLEEAAKAADVAAYQGNFPMGRDGERPYADAVGLFTFADPDRMTAFQAGQVDGVIRALSGRLREDACSSIMTRHYDVEGLRALAREA